MKKLKGEIKGELEVQGDLELTGDLKVEKWINVTGSIICNGYFIKAGNYIKAGSYIKAGGYIKAGDYIEAGYFYHTKEKSEEIEKIELDDENEILCRKPEIEKDEPDTTGKKVKIKLDNNQIVEGTIVE